MQTSHATGAAHNAVATHPLDPLTPDEIVATVELVRSGAEAGATAFFASVDLLEPPKAQLPDALATGERRVLAVLLDREARCTREVVVSLTRGEVLDQRRLDGAQPNLLPFEIAAVEELVRSHPDFQAALRRRGIEGDKSIMIDSWTLGDFDLPDERGSRLVKALAWKRDLDLPYDNGYARPIDGLLAIVDLYDMRIVRIDDLGVLPIPSEPGNYTPEAVSALRLDVRPIVIEQPQGASFTVDGNLVRWQNWHVRVGFTTREGLVLHTLGYEVDGELRSILHRASFVEMVVPYGDPSPTQYFKNAFDFGEYGIGPLTNSLELGCDCLGLIHYFDAAIVEPDGAPRTIRNAICLHEEDTGMLWKHTDWRTEHVEVRRGRRLVISSVATVGNYEYGFFWYLHQDGTIAAEVKLTGILQTAGLWPDEQQPTHGTLVAPGLAAPIHQHFFNVRLDVAVAGERNSVVEVNTETDPIGPENPHGAGFRAVETPLTHELGAQRDVNTASARYWRIVNPAVRNRFGRPVAYKLLPGRTTQPFLHPDAPTLRRAGFARHHVWVTPFAPDERFPAGEYPNQHPGGDGLPRWTLADRSIEDADIVLWYTFGAHHVPRPEDWPVMPVETADFMLKPDGFFDRSPALDVPASTAAHNGSCHHHHAAPAR